MALDSGLTVSARKASRSGRGWRYGLFGGRALLGEGFEVSKGLSHSPWAGILD